MLVTGHTGFKGSWLCEWLINLGAIVHGYSKDLPTDPALFQDAGIHDKIASSTFADVCDKEALFRVIEQTNPDFVFHLAAQPIVSLSVNDPITTFETNIMGVANVIDCVRRRYKPCTLIIITSDKCYENLEWVWGYRENDRMGGKDPYSASKGAAEIVFSSMVRTFKHELSDARIQIASARAGNVIGGGDWAVDRIVPDCYRKWSQGNNLYIRSPNATRPWQHVLEPVSGYLSLGMNLALQNARCQFESYNFGPDAEQTHTVENLVKDLAQCWRGEAAKIEIKDSTKFSEAGLLKLNCDKAHFDLKWKPVLTYHECVMFVSDWYNEYFMDGDVSKLTQDQINIFVEKAKRRALDWTSI